VNDLDEGLEEIVGEREGVEKSWLFEIFTLV